MSRNFLMPILFLFLVSCEQNSLKVDVSAVDVELQSLRFDKALFGKTENWPAKSKKLQSEYGEFYVNLTQMIPNIGDPKDPAHYNYLQSFAENEAILSIQSKIEEQFPNLEQEDEMLESAFKYYKYYFPKKSIPEIIYFNSAINASPVVNDNQMGIALDLFLGAEFGMYQELGFPQYLSKRMIADHLATNSLRGWLISEFPKPSSENLLSDMIYEGKLLYLMDALFPDLADSTKIEYSKIELEWCESFEASIWAHMVENELLYETEMVERLKFLNDGPFTSGMAKESPSRVGKWLGWQIVRSFMTNNELSIKELVALNDAQEILRKSAYKPRK